MLREVMEYLTPRPGSVLVDATLGGGGHAEALCAAAAPGGRLLGLDRDVAACAAAEARLRPAAERGGVTLHVAHANFAVLEDVLDELGWGAVDGVLFDVGASSPQFDTPERGFSYRDDAPLDMRMDVTQRTTAYHLVNGLSEDELAEIIRRFGEERWARRIAAFIAAWRRERGFISTTGELVEVIKAAVPAGARRGGPHPARRTFQALRMAVNNELGCLEAGLRAAVRRLRPGGRLVVLSFHSLEDRTVKQVLRSLAGGCTCPPDWPVCRCGAAAVVRALTDRPRTPTADEVAANPRSRSAKLRAAMRLDGPPGGGGTGHGGAAAPFRSAGARGSDSVGPNSPRRGRRPRGAAATRRAALRDAVGVVRREGVRAAPASSVPSLAETLGLRPAGAWAAPPGEGSAAGTAGSGRGGRRTAVLPPRGGK